MAKKIVMARRWFYLLTIVVVAGWTLFVAEWDMAVKIIVAVVGVAILTFLWFFLKTRRKNISRNAIDLEKKMLKKEH